MTPLGPRTALIGILLCMAGSAILSVNDMVMKALSPGHAFYLIILVRAAVGLIVLLGLALATGAGTAQFRTRRVGAHALRAGFVLISNAAFFLGLAAMPLAEAVAIGFTAPLLVTLLSVIVLGEHVGPRRWTAVIVGLAGVIVMLRPGRGVVDPAALLLLLSALSYAAMHMMTRRMRLTESALTMSYFTQLAFLALSVLMGLVLGDGRFAGTGNASLDHLLRAWAWPAAGDWLRFITVGLSVTVGGLMISQAYRICEAALVAPFEYTAMPFAIFWGIVIFGQWPDLTATIGIALIVGAGLYSLWRETQRRRMETVETRRGNRV